MTYPLWREIERRQQVFSSVFAWSAGNARLDEGNDSRLLRTIWVSPQTFRALGVAPLRGRTFEGDDSHCDAGAVIVSHRFWTSHFASQDSALGASVIVNDRPQSVVGVMPAGFFGMEAGKGFDIALPLCARQADDPSYGRRDLWWLVVMGRLRPGITLPAANAQIDAISRGVFDTTAPAGYDAPAMRTWNNFRLQAVSASGGISRLREEYSYPLWLLLGIAAMVLMIACSNLTNLLLTQAKSRETEIAVRLALGMTHLRLISQLLTESTILATLGAAAGSLLGASLSRFLVLLLTTSHDAIELNLSTDWRTLFFTAALAVAVCIVLAMAPLLRLSGTELAPAIRAGGRSQSQQPSHSFFQAGMLATQLAISLFLLVTSLTFVRSFHSLATLDAGFRQDGLVFCFIDYSKLRLSPVRLSAFRKQLIETFRRTPGVEEAAASTHVPLSGNSWTLGVHVTNGSQDGPARFSWVSGDYFRTLAIPLKAGRIFTDRETTRRVLVVNETFAKQFCPRTPAVGAVIRSVEEPGYPQTEYEIVGVVKDTRYDSLREPIPPAAYVPDSQNPNVQPWLSVIFRGSIPAAREALASAAPNLRVHFEFVRTLAEDSMSRERLLAWLSGIFATLATVLTAIGLYGVIGYIVSLRRSEIAVRMALGATAAQIVGMIVRNVAMVTLAGAAGGWLLSLAGGQFARSLLFHIAPSDPGTLLGALGMLATVSLTAALVPAVRASMTSPARALQHN